MRPLAVGAGCRSLRGAACAERAPPPSPGGRVAPPDPELACVRTALQAFGNRRSRADVLEGRWTVEERARTLRRGMPALDVGGGPLEEPPPTARSPMVSGARHPSSHRPHVPGSPLPHPLQGRLSGGGMACPPCRGASSPRRLGRPLRPPRRTADTTAGGLCRPTRRPLSDEGPPGSGEDRQSTAIPFPASSSVPATRMGEAGARVNTDDREPGRQIT